MKDRIRLATPEEVEVIKKQADLTPHSTVWAFGESRAVVRTAMEIDPVIWGENCPDIRKGWFIWGLENMLRGAGASEYYFNIHTDDKKFLSIAEGFGAENISKAPEFRFKKAL